MEQRRPQLSEVAGAESHDMPQRPSLTGRRVTGPAGPGATEPIYRAERRDQPDHRYSGYLAGLSELCDCLGPSAGQQIMGQATRLGLDADGRRVADGHSTPGLPGPAQLGGAAGAPPIQTV